MHMLVRMLLRRSRVNFRSSQQRVRVTYVRHLMPVHQRPLPMQLSRPLRSPQQSPAQRKARLWTTSLRQSTA